MSNGSSLTYGSSKSPWYSWEIENNSWNTFAVAALITIISYQATSLVFDILLGIKKRKVAKVNAFYTVLLTWKSSPLAMFNSMLRKDWLTRRYYQGDIPNTSQIAREKENVKPRVVLIIFVLLLAAPVIDTFSLILTLERSKTLTFAEAGFGGVGFGLRDDLKPVKSSTYSTMCRIADFETRRGDTVLTKFIVCDTSVVVSPIAPGQLEGRSRIRITIHSENHSIRFVVLSHGWTAAQHVLSFVQADDGKQYALKTILTRDSTEPLMNLGKNMLSEECGIDRPITPDGDPFSTEGDLLSAEIICPNATTDLGVPQVVVQTLARRITFVKSDVLSLAEISRRGLELNFGDRRDLVFLRRRQRNAGLLTLAAVAFASLIVRFSISSALSNDLVDGIDYLVKKRLGFMHCESMLKNCEMKVTYRNKFQEGGEAHYGLHQESMAEVKQFDGGVIGGNEDVDDDV